jgi:hypothetical protein
MLLPVLRVFGRKVTVLDDEDVLGIMFFRRFDWN